jgi:protein-disulfide isomerase
MGRSRSKKRAEERRLQQQKQRRRTIGIVVVVVAVIGVIGVILATRPVAVDIEGDILTRYEGIPTSTTDRGFAVLGNLDAPARLVEYSSFDCPSCRTFHEEVTVNLIDRVRNGEASFTYVPVFGTGGIPNGDRAAAAAICAGNEGLFFEYHDLLFEWQGQFVSAAFQPRRLEAGAEALGLDMDIFRSCLNSSETREVIDNARLAFAQSESTGTPTLFINDQRVSNPTSALVNNQIEAIMTTADPVPVVVEEAEAETTEEAVEEAEATEEAVEEPEATEES